MTDEGIFEKAEPLLVKFIASKTLVNCATFDELILRICGSK